MVKCLAAEVLARSASLPTQRTGGEPFLVCCQSYISYLPQVTEVSACYIPLCEWTFAERCKPPNTLFVGGSSFPAHTMPDSIVLQHLTGCLLVGGNQKLKDSRKYLWTLIQELISYQLHGFEEAIGNSMLGRKYEVSLAFCRQPLSLCKHVRHLVSSLAPVEVYVRQ